MGTLSFNILNASAHAIDLFDSKIQFFFFIWNRLVFNSQSVDRHYSIWYLWHQNHVSICFDFHCTMLEMTRSLFQIDETFNLITIIDLCVGCFRFCRYRIPRIHQHDVWVRIWCVEWKFKWKHFCSIFGSHTVASHHHRM